MKKFILFFIFFVGCGTVKKTSEEVSIKDNSLIEIDASRFSRSYTLEPVDLEKPILVGKDTIYNTRVIYNNTKEIIKEKKANDIEIKEDRQTKEVDYSESIKAVANRLILALVVLFILSRLFSRLKAPF